MKNNGDLSMIKVDLSMFPDRFTADNPYIEFSSSKPNFVYGKNGTGKSTITNAISDQFSESFTVKIYRDFDGVVENNKLNAIALGTENSELQKKINDAEEKIHSLELLVSPENNDPLSLNSKYIEAQKAYDSQFKKINKFFTDSAREITNSQKLGRTYDKNKFQKDIANCNVVLSKDNQENYRKILTESEKKSIAAYSIPKIDTEKLLKVVNSIIVSKIEPKSIIPELDNSPSKQEFAKDGMKLHQPDDVCAFCGNRISKERWDKLSSYFNDEVAKVEDLITKQLTIIDQKKTELGNIKLLDKDQFYAINIDKLEVINKDLLATINSYNSFLLRLKSALEEKRKKLFISMAPIEKSLANIKTTAIVDINELITSNNSLTKNLEKRRSAAADHLRLNEVNKRIHNFKYLDEDKKLIQYKASLDSVLDEIKSIQATIEKEKQNRKTLISKTKDESIVAKQINDRLRQNGVESFSLILADNDEGQQGQYRVIGHDGKPRDINALSKGEKNIVGFLYFVLSLQNKKKDHQKKIIIFDDPMTSNDDAMQYLMASELKRIYKSNNEDIFILLTHNSHFFLESRDRVKGQTYTKYLNYKLISLDNKHTTIKKIESGNEDVTVGCNTSWKNLKESYDNNSPDSMLIHCRKIIEYYTDFNNLDKNIFFKDNSLRRYFDVNAHAIETDEIDINSRSRDAIIKMFEGIFEANSAAEYFQSHWNAS